MKWERRQLRTALCTIAVGTHRELFEIARPSFERFAGLHGYALVVIADAEISAGRALSWGKVVALQRLLDIYDRVVWVDSDAVIVDPTADIFAGVSRRTPLSLVVHHYDGLEVPNAGVLTLRSCRWAKHLLGRLWEAERFIDHKWWENAALIELLGYDIDEPRQETRQVTRDSRRVGELDLAWNSIPGVAPAAIPRILHFAGMSHGDRLLGMRTAAAGG